VFTIGEKVNGVLQPAGETIAAGDVGQARDTARLQAEAELYFIARNE